jgi:excisionase family DNA binding protein
MADPQISVVESTDLNLKQAAVRLGVHYMTVYRYVRQGQLAAHRDGTEWRVSDEALTAFRTRHDPSPVAAATHTNDKQVNWPARLERCLLAGDEPAAWHVVERALAAGHDPSYCYLDMVAGSLTNIGLRWEYGELEASDQPVAIAVAKRVVSRLGARFRRPGRSRGSVVFGAPSGERHDLPIAIVADLVRIQGFDVLELGADLPPAAFVAAAGRAARLIAVGIGVTAIEHLDGVRATIFAIRAHHPELPILIGGQAVLNPEIANLAGATAWAADGREAVALIENIVAERRKALHRVRRAAG